MTPHPTGYLQPPAQLARHQCTPPVGESTLRAGAPGGPAVPVGTVWRCTCGRLWVVREMPAPAAGQVLADRRCWTRAGWRTRWRYRRGQAWEFAPWSELDGGAR